MVTTRIPKAKAYLKMGMKARFTDDYQEIGGISCPVIAIGSDHEDNFVKEVMYAVDLENEEIFRYDIITDQWLKIPSE